MQEHEAFFLPSSFDTATRTFSNGTTATPQEPTTTTTMDAEYIAAGDVVAVRHGVKGRVEGLVVGSHVDYAGRQVIEVQLDGAPELYHAWYPTVTRVRRTVYTRPTYTPTRYKTIERRIYW
ncbi:hypothetical protein D9611_013845 [Ephemerocybe angulata]|uniref:Uncharacterized protein n=2 Tax=Ephemerocybe angulata TaxID=980116 RepID=A0A8H5BV40_9AGAR|nr:hypothetical protein D9611_013845 [Tulosesus angulatus]